MEFRRTIKYKIGYLVLSVLMIVLAYYTKTEYEILKYTLLAIAEIYIIYDLLSDKKYIISEGNLTIKMGFIRKSIRIKDIENITLHSETSAWFRKPKLIPCEYILLEGKYTRLSVDFVNEDGKSIVDILTKKHQKRVVKTSGKAKSYF